MWRTRHFPKETRVTTTAVEFDPFSPEYFDDPTEVYRRLRDEAPVYFSERYGFYALSRFEDVVSAHRDWKGFSSAHGVDLSTLTKDPKLIRSLGMLIMMDPPEHDRFRTLVSRVFTPRAVVAPGADDPRGHLRPARRGGGPGRPSTSCADLVRALPRRDHLPDARRARGRAPADPRVARPHPAPRAGRGRPLPRGRGGDARDGRLLPRAHRGEAGPRPTTCSPA